MYSSKLRLYCLKVRIPLDTYTSLALPSIFHFFMFPCHPPIFSPLFLVFARGDNLAVFQYKGWLCRIAESMINSWARNDPRLFSSLCVFFPLPRSPSAKVRALFSRPSHLIIRDNFFSSIAMQADTLISLYFVYTMHRVLSFACPRHTKKRRTRGTEIERVRSKARGRERERNEARAHFCFPGGR